jgi:hypothetical protein
MKLIRTAALLSAFVVSAQVLPAQQRLPADSMELGRKFTQWLYTIQADSLLAYWLQDDEQPMTAADIERAGLQIATRAGNEVSVIEEKFITRNGARQYWRTAKMDILEEPFLLRWVISPEGKIAGIGMGPASQAPPIDP